MAPRPPAPGAVNGGLVLELNPRLVQQIAPALGEEAAALAWWRAVVEDAIAFGFSETDAVQHAHQQAHAIGWASLIAVADRKVGR